MAADEKNTVSFVEGERDDEKPPAAVNAIGDVGAALDRSIAVLERGTQTIDEMLAIPRPEEPAFMRDLTAMPRDVPAADGPLPRPEVQAKPCNARTEDRAQQENANAEGDAAHEGR